MACTSAREDGDEAGNGGSSGKELKTPLHAEAVEHGGYHHHVHHRRVRHRTRASGPHEVKLPINVPPLERRRWVVRVIESDDVGVRVLEHDVRTVARRPPPVRRAVGTIEYASVLNPCVWSNEVLHRHEVLPDQHAPQSARRGPFELRDTVLLVNAYSAPEGGNAVAVGA